MLKFWKCKEKVLEAQSQKVFLYLVLQSWHTINRLWSGIESFAICLFVYSHQFSFFQTIFMEIFNESFNVSADCQPESWRQGREQGRIVGQRWPQAQRRRQEDLRWQRIFEADRTSNSNIAATPGKNQINSSHFDPRYEIFLSFQQKALISLW